MPKGPSGQKRPADVTQNAVMVMRIATGEAKEATDDKDAAAVALGRKGGLKGGKARWAKLSPEERSEAASLAAQARWKRKKET